MTLKPNDFSNLEIMQFGETKIYIFDSHNFAFPIWTIESDRNKWPYKLVSFDYHTDICPSFNKYAFKKVHHENKGRVLFEDIFDLANKIREKRLREINLENIDSIINAATDLKNDEHILAAYDIGIINEYHIINHSEDISQYDFEYFYKNNIYEREDDCISFLDDMYIGMTRFNFSEMPIILDFDLDFFCSRCSLQPERTSIISTLIRNADLITITRETSYFNDLKIEHNFTAHEALEMLLNLIRQQLES